jgi:hypothetical protein
MVRIYLKGMKYKMKIVKILMQPFCLFHIPANLTSVLQKKFLISFYVISLIINFLHHKLRLKIENV